MNDKEYKEKFIKLGLSDQFDFISRDYSSYRGRKIIVRCRECGAEFSTWTFDQILKGRQSHLLCSKCGISSDGADVWNRSPQCEEAMAYYVQGHTVKETAEKFGVSTVQINNAVKVRNLTNGRSWGEISDKQKEKSRKLYEQQLKDRLDTVGFEYISGYTTIGGKVKIRCKKCRYEFERTADFAKHGNLVCQQCEHEEVLIRQRARKEYKKIESERRRVKREIEKIEKNPRGLSYYQFQREKRLDEVFTCKICGKDYTPREYMESEGLTLFSNVGYCSHECKRKAMNRLCKKNKKIRGIKDNHNHRQRARKYGCVYDPSVTLKKLIERDGLRCKICGEMCDPDDHTWSEYTGPMSPSIDHIIPIAKGGGHIWTNVQVAHVICNSYKRDNLGVV